MSSWIKKADIEAGLRSDSTISEECEELRRLRRVLDISTGGYYAWRKRGPSERERKDRMLTEQIQTVRERSRGTCGTPSIHAELRAKALVSAANEWPV